MVRWGYTQHHGDFHRPDFSFLPCPKGKGRINLMASCADLIVCSITTWTYPMSQSIFYHVCNLLTKQWAALPPAPQFQVKFINDVVIPTGLLCAPCSLCSTPKCVVGDNNNNFMVVRICVIDSSIHSQFDFKAQLFLSEKGEWKSVVVSSPRAVRFRVRSSTSLVPYKGMLHWLISGFVLVYDPYNCPERFCRVIDMPADIDMPAEEYRPTNIIAGEEERRSQTIGLFQDRLRVTHVWYYRLDPEYYIWELEDYNMGKWSLVHKISLSASPRLRPLRPGLDHHPPHLDPIVNLDPRIRETGFSNKDGSAFYWTNSSSSSGWWVANGIVHWINHQCWPTPVPPLTSCLHNSK